MTDEIATANAEADQSSVDNVNISVQDFAMRRLGELTPKAKEPQEETNQEPVEQETEEPPEETDEHSQEESLTEDEESSEESEESEDVLSQLDLDTMSEDELNELAKKLGSRAVARFGEMTAKRKAAEEQLAALQDQINNQNPLEQKVIKNNPYENINTIEALQEKSEELDNVIEWAENVLFESDGYGPEDVVTKVGDKELTKKNVRQKLLQARKAKKTFLPDQLNKVQFRQEGEQALQGYLDQTAKELDWFSDEKSEISERYLSTMSDPRMIRAKEVLSKEVPEVAAQLDYWFAHATNSIYGRKPVAPSAQKTKSSPTISPPNTGVPSSAQSEKTSGRTAKALKELETRFKRTGSARDFAELRKLKMSSRS